MRVIRSVSVHMPTWQGMEFLERAMDALLAQEIDLPWDITVVDSSSTDGTWEYLQGRAAQSPVPMTLHRIHGVEFDHGDTRNLMASMSRGDLLVFLTQDAIPAGPAWLRTLVANFEDPKVGGAYCRNVPRPDARLSTRILSATDPGYATEGRVQEAPANYAELTPDEQRLLYNFNDVASAVRRELWQRHPFPRTNFGEDVLMARALIEGGFQVVYDAVATVEHSHDYDPAQNRARGEIDGRFNAQWLGRVCLRTQGDVEFLLGHFEVEDKKAVEAEGLIGEAAEAVRAELRSLRRALFEGLQVGSQDPLRRPRTRLRADDRLKILYVVHGFPPDTWAGTEIYCLNLARGMAENGHEVTILARTGGEPGQENFALIEGEFEGLRVLRMVNHLNHRNLTDSYRDDRAEAVFARVLGQFRPDVVHFQHLIHGSIGNVAIARDAGVATVVTCHDFWALCPRVQMIQPDGTRCDHPQGAGCYPCIKDKGHEVVEQWARWNPPTLERAARLASWLTTPGARLGRRAGEFLAMRRREREVPAAYAACDLRISPSRFLRDLYLANGPFDPHTFLYSDNGLRTDHVAALEKAPHPGGHVRFGFVGTLAWYKGGETLVQAMKSLRDLPIELHIYGSFDPATDEHHKKLEELARGSRVTFHGRFDNSRLAEVYAQIDVLIVPSLWFENSPITIHEAHLTRTPVLASNIGGMAEYVRDGIDGLHFQVGDAQDLARVMHRFVQEPGLLAELSQDFPPLKTLDENVRETEFRYRGLACIERAVHVRTPPMAWRGMEFRERGGEVDRQGQDLALLRPGGWVQYDVPLDAPGCMEVHLLFLAEEPGLVQGGQVWIGELLVASLLPRAGRGKQETVRIPLDVFEPQASSTVRVTTEGQAGAPLHLRIEQILWRALR